MKAWQPGARVARWTLGDVLGQGGMGTVFRGRDPETGQVCAIKALASSAEPELRLRFQREGEAQARVDRHPNVLRIHSAGTEAGRPYLVMTLAEGGDLARRLEREGPFEPPRVARLGAELAEGLAHVHLQGVLHRDLKPQNVLFDEHDRPCLVDFGLAHLAGGQSLTEPGEVMGTPAYMPPEQASGAGADVRSDVYGLGAVLYHAATGRPPYRGRSALAVLEALSDSSPPSPREVRAEIPPDLDRVLRKAMARDPRRRYPDAASLAADLRRVEQGVPLDRGPSRGELVAAAVGALAFAGALGLGVAWALQPTPVPTPPVATRSSPPPLREEVQPSPQPSPTLAAAPSLEDELRRLRDRLKTLSFRPPEGVTPGLLQQFQALVETSLVATDPVVRGRALSTLGDDLRSRRSLLQEPLGYSEGLCRRLLEAGALSDDPISLHELANYLLKYERDLSPHDLERAEQALIRSAKAEYPIAMRALGKRLINSGDPAKLAAGVGWLEKATPADREAMVTLARVLLPDQGFEGNPHVDPDRAIRLLNETANSNALAAGILAAVYMDGELRMRDTARAEALLRGGLHLTRSVRLFPQLGDLLRERQDPECLEHYRQGLRREEKRVQIACHRGLASWYTDDEPDNAKQLAHVKHAARLGDSEAAVLAARLHRRDGDYDAAFHWFRQAAGAGESNGGRGLAEMLLADELPKGMVSEVPAALRALGDAASLRRLGQLYEGGLLGPPDLVEARRLYIRAAEMGNATACGLAARFLIEGLGGPPNPKAAQAWMDMAVKLKREQLR